MPYALERTIVTLIVSVILCLFIAGIAWAWALVHTLAMLTKAID